MSIWLWSILLGSGLLRSNMDRETSSRAGRVVLLPVGRVEERALGFLEMDLAKAFGLQVVRHRSMAVPQDAFNPSRRQYDSSRILRYIRDRVNLEGRDKGLGITDVDLYAGGLNFVFGQAELGGQWAVISLARLRQSFHSLPEDEGLFSTRTVKEAVHELGHVFGLEHCPDPQCVMHFSNSLADTDRKRASFCAQCQARLQELKR